MDSTHSRFFIISFAFQCLLKLRTHHLRTLLTSPGELNCHNNFLFVWRFSIKAEPFVSVISPFKISLEKSSFYNKSLPQTRFRSNCKGEFVVLSFKLLRFRRFVLSAAPFHCSRWLAAQIYWCITKRNKIIIWLNIAYSLVME